MRQSEHGKPARVLVLVESLRDNGGLRVSHDIARRWRQIGVPVQFMVLETVTPHGPMLEPDPALETVYGSDQARRFRRSAIRILLNTVRRAQQSDVVVSASEIGWGMLLGWVAARCTGRPFVALVHSPLPRAIETYSPRGLHGAVRWTHRRADRTVCVSDGLVAGVVENGQSPDRVSVIQPGIDAEEMARRINDLPRISRENGPIRLIAIGRLAPEKGFDLLLRALRTVHAEGTLVALTILGFGPDWNALNTLAEREGVKEQVTFEGFVDDPHPYLARADAFVLSSRYEGTGSIALLEAMAHGLPVIAADCVTGPRSVLRDGEFGELVPAEDPDALADAILRFVRQPEELRSRAIHAPKRAAEFDRATASSDLLRILGEVVNP